MIFIKKSKKIILSAVLCFVLLSGLNSNSFIASAKEPDGSPPAEGLPKGYVLIEGDILVPEISTRGLYTVKWWPNGVVPYEFDGNVSTANRALAVVAMSDWEATATLFFQPRNGESNYIHIQDHESANNSMVGMIGGEQIINIHNWNEFTIVHELGHALALWHEQSRADRNTYITINWHLIHIGNWHNFDMHSEGYMIGPYDFDSIMHYGQCAFSICADCSADPDTCRTITVKPDWSYMQDEIGHNNHLSVLDEITMSLMYPENGTVFVDKHYTGTIEAGTLYWPFKSFNTGYSVAPALGTVVIKPGSYNETGLYSKAMLLKAPLGGVVLGE